MPPLVAVMVIVYTPGGFLWNVRIVSVDVPDPPEPSKTPLELRLSLGPDGEHTADRDTVPLNPFMLARLMMRVAELPAATLRELTLVLRLKSWTFTVIVTEWVNEPLVPVTVTA